MVMLTGTCFLAMVVMIVKLQIFVIFHLTPDVYTMLTVRPKSSQCLFGGGGLLFCELLA